MASLTAYGQGTVLFANFDAGTGLNAPVFMDDGITPLSGSIYAVALLAGPTDNSLQRIAVTNFLSGAQSGYFNGGVQSITNVVGGGIARIHVIVWNSDLYPSFAAAQASAALNVWGDFPLFSIVTGNPAGAPPSPPAVLVPLATFFLQPLDILPPHIHQSYNPISQTVILSFTGNLQTSTDLMNWTNVAGASPQTFPANQAHQYFRVIQ